MKAKKLLAILIALLIAVTCVASASAAQLTDEDPSGRTEVIARVIGDAGEVSYIITIPAVVDFGVLTQPSNIEDNNYTSVDYTVTLDEVTGLDPTTQQISVYVKDQNATVDSINNDQRFYIANKTNSNIKFEYEVFDFDKSLLNDNSTSIAQNTMVGTAGYFLYGFTEVNQAVNGSLRINQNQLYGYDLTDIVGDYSGYMVFFSAIEDNA